MQVCRSRLVTVCSASHMARLTARFSLVKRAEQVFAFAPRAEALHTAPAVATASPASTQVLATLELSCIARQGAVDMTTLLN